ncbi:MAG: cell division protein FtsB [Methylophaga sp.]|nr:cell division protein FtsB [Methylophaga sp.]
MKPVMILLIVILVVLQYRLWLSHDGLPSLLRLHYAVEKQRQDNDKLQERNAVLAAEVADLKSGLDALEERARSELGMVKPDETFFHVIEPETETDD